MVFDISAIMCSRLLAGEKRREEDISGQTEQDRQR
jgi:hypothetical protein